jgi:diaminopimelate decarboxylase
MFRGSTLFPLTAKIGTTQHLVIGGCDTVALAQQFGTPLYVFDAETIRVQAERASALLQKSWHDSLVLYATKAYFAPFLARIYDELGLGLDVTSEGEIVIAGAAGFDPSRIYVHGNNKTSEELGSAFTHGISHFVVDNLDEVTKLDSAAAEFRGRVTARCLIRLSPNIDAHTHRYMTTGVADSKFGLGIQNGMAEQAARECVGSANLRLVGLHFHIGSQVFDADALREALNVVLDAAADWRHKFGFELQELNIGGGWGVAYNESQTSLDIENFLTHTTQSLCEGLKSRGLPETLKLLVEPGRGLIARSGVALYRVGSVKEIPNVRSYIAIDGGMGDNVRPALYGAQYSAFLANRMRDQATKEYAIAGRYCEQGDVLIERAELPETRIGDLVAVPVAGAYQLPMASNYNLIPRPAVVVVNDGVARLVRRRETIKDMLACDVDS